MSKNAQLEARYYHILSVAAGNAALAGVGPIQPTFQSVHIDATINIWHFEQQAEPGVFRLSLKDSYPYTGVDVAANVIATVEEAEEKVWNVRYWDSQEAFSIDLNSQIRPARAWTLSSDKPDAKIVIGTYEVVPDKSQLFRIVQVQE